MSQSYDSVPKKFDAKMPKPTRAEVAAMFAAAAPAPAAPGPYPEVNTLLTDGPGVYGYYDESKRYGLAETIAALREIGAIWERRYPGRRFGVGDISKRGGGDIDGHASHEKGVDADIRLVRSDWAEQAAEYQDHEYSHDLTQELIDLFWTNSHLGVKFVFFNDPRSLGTSEWPNHDNHFHVRFYPPGDAVAPPVLRRGNDKKAANHELQRCLNFWKQATAQPGADLILDGDFGQRTFDRVSEFQTAQGIESNGVVASATWERLQGWRMLPGGNPV